MTADSPIAGADRPALLRARRTEAALLATPALIPVVLFSVVPLLLGMLLAFTQSSLAPGAPINFVGTRNFTRLVHFTAFWQSFRIGLVWAMTTTFGQFICGLGLSLLLNTDLRFRVIARVLALLPWAMPPVAVAITWQMIYSPVHGPLDWLVSAFGGTSGINWLGSFSLALPAVVLVGIWAGMPQNTIVLLAGLQQIPGELYEAATVDGAGAWRRFVHVTWPGLRRIVVSITALSFIWNFNSFGLVYVMTQGGPGGKTLLPMLFTYLEAFGSRDFGMAAAMGDVIVVFLVIILALYLRIQMRGERL